MSISADKTKLLATARSQLGIVESPPYSNRTKYGEWYGMNGVAWCAIWVSWVFWHSGNPLPKITTKKGFAYVPEVVRYGTETGTFHRGVNGATPGDIAVWKFAGGPNRPNHVSIVGGQGRLSDGRIHSLDGNSNASGSRTGGGVVELYRRTGFYGYVRVANRAIDVPSVPTTPGVPSVPVSDEEDFEMASHIRLNAPGNPHHGRIELVGPFHRRWVPPEEWNLHIFLGGKPAQNVDLNGWNAITSNKQHIVDGKGA